MWKQKYKYNMVQCFSARDAKLYVCFAYHNKHYKYIIIYLTCISFKLIILSNHVVYLISYNALVLVSRLYNKIQERCFLLY